jgi:hypothetical protein
MHGFAAEATGVGGLRIFRLRREIRRPCRSSAPAFDDAPGATHWSESRRRTPPKEKTMAKSQRRGNKEARKPKATKPQVAATASPFAARGATIPDSPPKRKG